MIRYMLLGISYISSVLRMFQSFTSTSAFTTAYQYSLNFLTMRYSSFLASLAFLGLSFALPSRPHISYLQNRQLDPGVKWDTIDHSKLFIDPDGTTVFKDTWIITEKPWTPTFAGHASKKQILVNGQFPPPTVKVPKGTRIEITVVNPSVDGINKGVSLHPHGLVDEVRPWMSGAVGLTQKAIGRGKRFTYIWTSNNQTGTYWIHSHVGSQYPRGLRSPLVILDGTEAEAREQYGGDRVIALSDWYNRDYDLLDRLYLDKTCGEGLATGPDDAVINDNKQNKTQILIPSNQIPNRSRQIRLRFVNLSAASSFFLYIRRKSDGRTLPMKIIEVDGVQTQPQEFHVVTIHSGQRYSAVVDFTDIAGSPGEGYALIAALDPKDYRSMQISKIADPRCQAITTPGSPITTVEGIRTHIPYDWADIDFEDNGSRPIGGSEWSPKSTISGTTMNFLPSWVQKGSRQWDGYQLCFPWIPRATCDWNDDAYFKYDLFDDLLLQPTTVVSGPRQPPDRNTGVFPLTFALASNGFGGVAVGNASVQNHVTGNRTVLELVYNDVYIQNWGQGPSGKDWPVESNTIDVGQVGRWIWIVIISKTPRHPIHLGGSKFQVLHTSRHSGNPPAFDYDGVPVPAANPVRRDTLLLEQNQMVVLAMKTDIAGIRAIHCHIDWHLSTGMMAQMIVGRSQLKADISKLDLPGNAVDLAAYNQLQSGEYYPATA